MLGYTKVMIMHERMCAVAFFFSQEEFESVKKVKLFGHCTFLVKTSQYNYFFLYAKPLSLCGQIKQKLKDNI